MTKMTPERRAQDVRLITVASMVGAIASTLLSFLHSFFESVAPLSANPVLVWTLTIIVLFSFVSLASLAVYVFGEHAFESRIPADWSVAGRLTRRKKEHV
jgi:hypothetical protein